MPQILIRNLSFSYDTSFDPVFENLSLTLDTNWKLGLIGRNGRGKTTLLRLLAGAYPYQGVIRLPAAPQYFPAPIPVCETAAGALLESLAPPASFWRVERELTLLGFPADGYARPYRSLSPGEQTKAQLALLFAQENAFLLIDEPTNHLDAESRRLVCRYLQGKQGFLLVSHDRRFLDGCIDHVLALGRRETTVTQGNFSTWLLEKQRRDAREQAQNVRLQREIQRLDEAARVAAGWSDKVEKRKKGTRTAGLRPDRGRLGHKAAKLMQRAKNVEQRIDQARTQKAALLQELETAEPLKLAPLFHAQQVLVEAAGLCLFYGAREVVHNLRFTVRQGECVALTGPNGCGKSTVFRKILGEAVEAAGKLKLASGLVISYVPQRPGAMSGPLSQFAQRHRLEKSLFYAVLRKLGLSRVQLEKPLEEYSTGQKKKVLLARSLCQSAHLYLWDEPLNFIDVFSRMQLEDLLQAYRPTLLLIEHDEAFLQAVADNVASLDGAPVQKPDD